MSSTFPSVKAVVFDLDGLMLNTEDVFQIAGQQLLSRRNRQMTDEIHHRMLGRRPDEAFQVMKDLTGITDSIADLKAETFEIFSSVAEDHLALMPGLTDLLQMIEDENLPKGVATSSPRDYMQDLLNRFQLLPRFSVTLAAEDVILGKPEPEIYLKAAELLNVMPAEMLVLEDSETGTRAAAAAGAFVVSVPNSHTERGDFSMASLVVDSLAHASLRQLVTGIG